MNSRPVAVQLVSTGGFYGAERALLELAVYLRDSGWDSRIVALEGRGAAELVRRATVAGISACAFTTEGRLSAWKMMGRLRATLAECGPAVLHSHGYKPDLLLAALRAPASFACLATCHSWYSETLKLKAVEWADKRVLRGFDHVIAVSEEILGELTGSGVPAAAVSRIDNGISVPVASPSARDNVRRELGVGPGERLIVQIGRLARSKRSDLLIEAMSRLKDRLATKMAIIGDGELRDHLKQLAGSLGLERRISFLGYRDNAADFLAAADLMVLTSDKEGLPITILEAMAIGCPIVATAVGAIPRALTSEESALIIPAGDTEALVAAIERSFEQPARTRQRTESARAQFAHRFSREAMGARYLEIYRRVWEARSWGQLPAYSVP